MPRGLFDRRLQRSDRELSPLEQLEADAESEIDEDIRFRRNRSRLAPQDRPNLANRRGVRDVDRDVQILTDRSFRRGADAIGLPPLGVPRDESVDTGGVFSQKAGTSIADLGREDRALIPQKKEKGAFDLNSRVAGQIGSFFQGQAEKAQRAPLIEAGLATAGFSGTSAKDLLDIAGETGVPLVTAINEGLAIEEAAQDRDRQFEADQELARLLGSRISDLERRQNISSKLPKTRKR